MRMQDIVNEVTRQRLGQQPQMGMASGGFTGKIVKLGNSIDNFFGMNKASAQQAPRPQPTPQPAPQPSSVTVQQQAVNDIAKRRRDELEMAKGMAEGGPLVLNDESIRAMDSGMSAAQAIQSNNSGYSSPSVSQPMSMPAPAPVGLPAPSTPSPATNTTAGLNSVTGSQYNPSTETTTMANGNTFAGQDFNFTSPMLYGRKPNRLATSSMARLGLAQGGPVATPILDVSKQPTITPVTPQSLNQPVYDVRQQPTVPTIKLGMACGGKVQHGYAGGGPTVGLIEGKVDPTVADDTTITTPSGAEFNAKIGEYVIPQEVVAAKGTEFFDNMVLKTKQKLGLPLEMGPKTHDEPDSQGRMDKPGLPMMMGGADGGDIYGRRTAFDDVLDATGNAVVGGVKSLPVIAKALGNAYSTTLGNQSTNGSGAPTYAADPYDTNIADTTSAPPVTVLPQKLGNTATANIAPVRSEYAIPSAAMKQARMGIINPSDGGKAYDPTASTTAEAANNAIYAKQAAQQDADRAAYREQQGFEARQLGDRNMKQDITNATNNLAYLSTLGPDGDGKSNSSTAQMRLNMLLDQQNKGIKQQEVDNVAQGQRLGLQGTQYQSDNTLAGTKLTAEEGAKARMYAADQIRIGREAEAKDKALYTPNKTEAARIAAEGKREERIIAGRAALMSKPEWYSLTPEQQSDALNQLELDSAKETWVAGTAGQEGTSGFLGIGGKPAVPAKAGYRQLKVPAGRESDVQVAQKLMAKYGDRAKAELAYKNGER